MRMKLSNVMSSPPPDNQLTGGQQTMKDIQSEVAKLQAGLQCCDPRKDRCQEAAEQRTRWAAANQVGAWTSDQKIQRLREADSQNSRWSLRVEIHHTTTQWELFCIYLSVYEIPDYLQLTQQTMLSFPGMGCRHCNPGWTFLHLRCYYFAFSVKLKERRWKDARQFCQKLGGDLAVIDTPEKTVRFDI